MGIVSISTNVARTTVRQLIEYGVSDFVLSPGSRNAPLSIALHQASQRGLIRLHVRIDERSAGFFALGIAKATDTFVPVICTSGTALANYLPAVMEAHHSAVKLLVISADRPDRLRNTGANQTTIQKNIFGRFVEEAVDTSAPIQVRNLLGGRGPVHINLQFDEPLLPTDNNDWLSGIHFSPPRNPPPHKSEVDVLTTRNILVVGHDRAGFSVHDIETLSHDLSAPILAEDPLSFATAVAHAPIVLSDERVRKFLVPELAVVIGRTTLSRSTNSYLQGVRQTIVIDPRIATVDKARSGDEILLEIPRIKNKVAKNLEWFSFWEKYSTLASQAITLLPTWCEGRIAEVIAEKIPTDCAFFISSSRPVRDLEAFANPRNGIVTYANRGLAGIDGNISTALGIATHSLKTFALIGDLSFLHDVSALTNIQGIDLTIVVVDNNGGGIFSTLPQRGREGFEEIFGTPHGLDIAKIAESYGVPAVTVKTLEGLSQELLRAGKGVHVIIAKALDRESNADSIAGVIKGYSELVAF